MKGWKSSANGIQGAKTSEGWQKSALRRNLAQPMILMLTFERVMVGTPFAT
jgi:hypothetical protein